MRTHGGAASFPPMAEDLSARPGFLVERYLPDLTIDALTALAARLTSAANQLRPEAPVSWLGSTALLEEETILCAFRAPSRDAVLALNKLALAPYERISKALFVEGKPHK
jgi:Nickel responsive protein SCO4226-like